MPRQARPSPFDDPSRLFTLSFRVRYAETDPMGFVHNSNYLTYLEMARIEALRQKGISYRELEERGSLIVVARADLRFRAPARLDDVLTLELGVARSSRVRLDQVYRIWRADHTVLCLEAETTVACVTREGQLRELPPEVLAAMPDASAQPGARPGGGHS